MADAQPSQQQSRLAPSDLLDRSLSLSDIPWWALVLLLIGLLFTYLILSNPNYSETFDFLIAGVIITFRMTMIAFSIALILGLIFGLMRTSNITPLYTIATLYIETVRGIPLIVLMLYVAFVIVPVGVDGFQAFGVWGAAQGFPGVIHNLFAHLATFSIRQVNMEMRAISALSIGYGAYEAEVFRAGIQSIGRGQIEAARSLGMTYFQTMRLVVLPQAIRRILPPLGNDFIAMLKDSSLATVLAVREITQLGRLRRGSTFRVFETFNVVAFLYLAMTLVLSAVMRFIERKLHIEE